MDPHRILIHVGMESDTDVSSILEILVSFAIMINQAVINLVSVVDSLEVVVH